VLEDLLPILEQKYASNNKARVIIRGDKRLPAVEVQKVMTVIGQSGISDISFSALQPIDFIMSGHGKKKKATRMEVEAVNLGFQIAPMIDVVFVIMLFFMVMAGSREGRKRAQAATAGDERR